LSFQPVSAPLQSVGISQLLRTKLAGERIFASQDFLQIGTFIVDLPTALIAAI